VLCTVEAAPACCSVAFSESSSVSARLENGLAAARRAAEKHAARAGLADEDRELAIGKHLHDAYCAAEAALERLVLAIDGGLPQGRRYHQDLLERVAHEVAGIRPAVIGRDTLRGLRQLLGFRHVFRHQYETFDYALAEPNVALAAAVVPQLAAEVEDFAKRSGLKPPA
jgi:hypothetical protein